MKISTENIDIELTINEFEDIIDRGLLDSVISTVVSLSSIIELSIRATDEDLMKTINDLIQDDLFTDDDDECTECGKCAGPHTNYIGQDYEEGDEDDDNYIVSQLYETLFGNGEAI